VKARISADGRLLPSDDEQGRDSRSRHVRHSPRQRRDSLVLLSNRDRASRHAGQATRFARKQGATRALRPSASARVSVGRAPDPDDTRASGPAPARRLFATTSRRVGRAFSSSTVSGRRACRSSRGPCGDAGNNPCRRQADQVVAPGSTGRRLVEDDHCASRGRLRSSAHARTARSRVVRSESETGDRAG
jgi:hypothetical protein